MANLKGLDDFLVVYWHDDRDRFLPENRETVRNVGCQSSVVFVQPTRWVELSQMSDEIGHGDLFKQRSWNVGGSKASRE